MDRDACNAERRVNLLADNHLVRWMDYGWLILADVDLL
jgi:hypothetical protein